MSKLKGKKGVLGRKSQVVVAAKMQAFGSPVYSIVPITAFTHVESPGAKALEISFEICPGPVIRTIGPICQNVLRRQKG